MKSVRRFLFIIGGVLLLTSMSALAEVKIVEVKIAGEPVLVVKDGASGKILGNFWKDSNGTSDFGYDNSLSCSLGVKDFMWSKDRMYVAVLGGAARSSHVYIYQVKNGTLTLVEIPELSKKQRRPLNVDNVRAEGTDEVRWQADGTLLLRYWAASRVTEDEGGQHRQEGEVWVFVKVDSGTAKIIRTTTKKP